MTVRLGVYLQEIDIPEAGYNSDFCKAITEVINQALSDFNEHHKKNTGEYLFWYTFFNAEQRPKPSSDQLGQLRTGHSRSSDVTEAKQ